MINAAPEARAPSAELEFTSGLYQAIEDLAAYEHAAVMRWGAAALGAIDLPPLSEDPVDAGQVRAAAGLLWAREAEGTGLAEFGRALVEGRRGPGGVRPPAMTLFPFDPPALRALVELRTTLRDLPGEAERQAFYLQVFADPFDAQLESLIVALSEYGAMPARDRGSTERIRTAAVPLASLLSQRTRGGVPYVANRVQYLFVSCHRALRSPAVLRGLGGRSGGLLSALSRHAQLVLGHPIDPHTAARRASAGEALVRWLSEVAPRVGAGMSARDALRGARAAERWQLERPR